MHRTKSQNVGSNDQTPIVCVFGSMPAPKKVMNSVHMRKAKVAAPKKAMKSVRKAKVIAKVAAPKRAMKSVRKPKMMKVPAFPNARRLRKCVKAMLNIFII